MNSHTRGEHQQHRRINMEIPEQECAKQASIFNPYYYYYSQLPFSCGRSRKQLLVAAPNAAEATTSRVRSYFHIKTKTKSATGGLSRWMVNMFSLYCRLSLAQAAASDACLMSPHASSSCYHVQPVVKSDFGLL